MSSAFSVRSEQRSFEGVQGFYEHVSAVAGGAMRFAVYQPPAAIQGAKVPVLYYLAGLTCTEETFAIKAGAQRMASQLGLMLVSCDTSPRAVRLPGDDASWDFGLGAGFYLDATEAPWSSAYRMRSYVTRELRELVERHFPVREGPEHRGIFGHSMGGCGALAIALSHSDEYASASAFAPIVAPSEVPWGIKAFGNYLGPDRARWAAYDPVALLESGRRFGGTRTRTLLIDQGTADNFLERELQPELLERACQRAGQALELRRRPGYDHSYYFIQSFIDEHLQHHARALRA